MAADIKRLNYFTGQFLDASDFADEQAYHRNMRLRNNRILRGPGVLDGLDVSGVAGAREVSVGVGCAIDSQGRELVLLPATGSATAITVPLPPGLSGTVNVVLGYDEQATDSHSAGGYSGATRVTEKPTISISAGAVVDPQIQLASLVLDAGGSIASVNPTTRMLSSILLGPGFTLSGKGRMHINGPEQLFLLNSSGVVVGKEWGGNGSLTVEGNAVIGGSTRAAGEIATTSANAFRMVSGNFGSFFRNDGASTYLLLTNPGDQYGNWNNLRPFSINNTTGDVGVGKLAIDGDVAISGKHALRGNDGWLRLNQDGQFASGVHTPHLFAPNSLNVGGVGGWADPGAGNATIAGTLTVAGTIKAGGEIQSTSANAFRMVCGNFGSFFRNDGLDTYLLLTKTGDQYGNWNDLRPLRINNATGNVYLSSLAIDGDVAISGKHALRGNDSWLRLNQDGAFTSGVHTPHLLAPNSLNVGGVGGWADPGAGNATIAGTLNVSASLKAGGEIQSTSANAFRMVCGNFGSFFRNDGSDTYLLLTRAGDPYGGWNDLRPLRINNTSGDVSLGKLSVNGDITITGKIGNAGYSPTPRNPAWGGGVHTWDIEAEGSIWSAGDIWCLGTHKVNHADIAENYLSKFPLETGDVVRFDPAEDAIVRTTEAYDALVCGVVSSSPGLLLNSDARANQDGLFPVALSGRVPCKVVAENGPIRRGDLLTSSSLAGHAMKAIPPESASGSAPRQGTVIGKALGTLDAGSGVIDAFVFLS